jgi:hypothetical protein
VLKALKNVDKKFSGALENKRKQGMHIELRITAKNRFGLLRDVSSIFYRHVLDLMFLSASTSNNSETAYFKVEALVADITDVSRIFEELEQFEDVYSVYRVSDKGMFRLLASSIIAVIVWVAHPFILRFSLQYRPDSDSAIIADILLFLGLSSLFAVLLILNSVVKRYFPLVRNKRHVLVISTIVSIVALALVFFELKFFDFPLSEFFISVLGLFVVFYFGFSYIKLRRL